MTDYCTIQLLTIVLLYTADSFPLKLIKNNYQDYNYNYYINRILFIVHVHIAS